jgi:hypothetical protein
MAYERTTSSAQEKTQEVAQEVKRIAQEATAESRKAKKAEHYRVMMEKLGKLPPCPKLCRGGECDVIPCEEEPGFHYSHINDMVVCPDKSHMSMASRGRSYLFHLWPTRKRPNKPAQAKNLGGGTSGARNVPPEQPQQPVQDWETAECQRHWERDPAAAAAAPAAASRVAAAARS